MPKITLIGDAVIDNFISLPDGSAEVYCDIQAREGKLIIPYGEKLAIENAEQHCGGNAPNVAVALKKLGVESIPIIPIGTDFMSSIANSELLKEGIEIKPPYLNSSVTINTSYILRYRGERTILSHHIPKEYPLPQTLSTPYLYFSSHSANNTTLSISVLKLLDASKAKLIFCPSNTHIFGDKFILQTLIQNSLVIICNATEASEIVKNIDTQKSEIKEIVDTLHHFGSHHVVVSDGSNGVYFRDGDINEIKHIPAPKIDPKDFIDVTGAGDALSSGVIYSLIQNKTLEEGVILGQKLSANVIKHVGSMPGLLDIKDLLNSTSDN